MAYKTCFNIIKYLGAAIYTADVSETHTYVTEEAERPWGWRRIIMDE